MPNRTDLKVPPHNGRLIGWTDLQIVTFNAILKSNLRGKSYPKRKLHPRVLHSLRSRRVVMENGDGLILTAHGSAVAVTCGWIKQN